MTMAVKISNLNFSYGETPVLQDINLEVCTGAMMSIIGPNGGGKTHEDWPVPMFLFDSRGLAAPANQTYTEAHVLAAVAENPALNLPSGAAFFRRFVEQEGRGE